MLIVNIFQGIYHFFKIDITTRRPKLDTSLENKAHQKIDISKNVNAKSCCPIQGGLYSIEVLALFHYFSEGSTQETPMGAS